MKHAVVGLTGGIGSGKSTASALFAAQGVLVIDTDDIAHQLTSADGEAMPALRQIFDLHAFLTTGDLNRAYVRQCICENDAKKQQLENILHPLIFKKSQQLLHQAVSVLPYVLLVVPLLFEHYDTYRSLVRRTLLIDCEVSLQIERTCIRDQCKVKAVEAILAFQYPRAKKRFLADDILVNNQDTNYLMQQVARQHQYYLHHFAIC